MDTLNLVKFCNSFVKEWKEKEKAVSTKSRVKVFDSIYDALKHGHMGQVFSTKASQRLYVITKSKWGKSGQQTVNGRTAKGFSAGSIPSSFKDVKQYSVRTQKRHGKASDSRFSKDYKAK